MNSSPFEPKRFEYEGQHLYFLPSNFSELLEPPSPAYLVGSRGTGKTTLLKALAWNERLSNESLKRQLGHDAFSKEYIGVYLKLPEYVLNAFDARLASESDLSRALVPGIYLDAIALQLLSDAIAELISNNVLRISADDEQACVAEVFAHLWRATNPYGRHASRPSTTLKGLSQEMRRIQTALADYAVHGRAIDASVEQFLTAQCGQLGRDVGGKLGDLCNRSTEDGTASWHFKVCMDEGECLSVAHQRVLNTLVRLSKWPLFHLVSFVRRPEDPSTTYVPNLSLSDADRRLVLLDQMNDKEFRSLAEGVSTVRIQERLKDFTVKFDAIACLGRLSINQLLLSILSTSEKAYAKKLLKSAREIAKEPFFANLLENQPPSGDDEQDTAGTPLIYQAYLLDKLRVGLPEPSDPKWMRRAQQSANLRKKMVAAYLSLCAELGADVRYASAKMVLQMSDLCIRDYLNFLHEIFVESKLPVRGFIEQTPSLKVQDAAIKRASLNKRNSLRESGVLSPTEAGRIIDALAEITRIVQTTGPGKAPLEATERGLFTVDFSEGERKTYAELLALIRDAAEAGFLVVIQEGSSSKKFRVHTSLSAAYGFSYRGAYYNTLISLREIDEIRHIADPKRFAHTVKRIGERLAGGKPETGSLFVTEGE